MINKNEVKYTITAKMRTHEQLQKIISSLEAMISATRGYYEDIHEGCQITVTKETLGAQKSE